MKLQIILRRPIDWFSILAVYLQYDLVYVIYATAAQASEMVSDSHSVYPRRQSSYCKFGNRSVSHFSSSQSQYVFSNKPQGGSHTLSLLSSEPVNPKTAIGVTSKLPPSTDSFRENPNFLKILQEVISEYGHKDPDAISQAQVMVSTSGANISSGGVLMTGQSSRRRRESKDSSGGASGQGGVGSAGRGGWIHLSDSRRPPEYGRIAW